MADNSSSAPSETVSNPPATSNGEEKKDVAAGSDAPAKSDAPESAAVESKEPESAEKAEPNSAEDKPSASEAAKDADTEMKDAPTEGADSQDVAKTAPETVEEATTTPATPAAGKRPNGSASSKKKSAGVPEHKSKKLNKKKSKAELKLNLDCKPGELYLARMKGHAPWPSIVCDEEILPVSLLNSRPVTTAQADGTFKRPDYAPGGKRQGERTFPIMFLYTNEFAWLPNVDLTPITPEECKEVEEKGKSKSLVAAFAVAAEGHDLQHYKTMLSEHQAAIQADLDSKAEKEAEKAAAKAAKADAKKARRKSAPAAEDEGEDAMEVDEDGEEKPKSKKRKKVADADDDAEEKPAKTPKLKLNGPKTPGTDKRASQKPKASKKAAKKDSDEELEDAMAAEASSLTPAELKEKKEKEIRYYRHKLQKGLLGNGPPPSDEEVATASNWLGKLENYQGLEGDIIRSTKIHKVLRAMIRLPSIPKDEVYELKKRSTELLQKWNAILDTDDPAVDGPADASAIPDPAEKKIESTEEKPVESATESKESESKVNGTSESSASTAPKAEESNTDAPKTEEPKADTPAATAAADEPVKSIEADKPAEAQKTEDKPAETAEKAPETSA